MPFETKNGKRQSHDSNLIKIKHFTWLCNKKIKSSRKHYLWRCEKKNGKPLGCLLGKIFEAVESRAQKNRE